MTLQSGPSVPPSLVLSETAEFDGFAYLRMRSEGLIDGRNELRFPGKAEERSEAFGLYRDDARLRASLTVYLPRWEPFSREPAGAGR